jgi:hypothetical protein
MIAHCVKVQSFAKFSTQLVIVEATREDFVISSRAVAMPIKRWAEDFSQ